MPAPWSLPYSNEHGVLVREAIPLVCCDCPFYEDGEFADDGSRWSYPVCMRGVKFPVRKGTCKMREKAEMKRLRVG